MSKLADKIKFNKTGNKVMYFNDIKLENSYIL